MEDGVGLWGGGGGSFSCRMGGWGGVVLVAEWSEEYLNKKKSGLKKVEGLQLSFEEPGSFFLLSSSFSFLIILFSN